MMMIRLDHRRSPATHSTGKSYHRQVRTYILQPLCVHVLQHDEIQTHDIAPRPTCMYMYIVCMYVCEKAKQPSERKLPPHTLKHRLHDNTHASRQNYYYNVVFIRKCSVKVLKMTFLLQEKIQFYLSGGCYGI